MLLSIVIITKNEELVIEKCIKSTIVGCNKVYAKNDFEIILVDSLSDDDTLIKSKRILQSESVMNWKIIQYKSSCYTAAQSREIGRKYCKGESVLFLDGDMILYSRFLKFLNDHLTTRERDIVGFVGKRIDAFYNSEMKIVQVKQINRKIDRVSNTLHPGGGAYYLGSEIKKTHYNIEQRTREEESFAKKLAAEGKKIRYLDVKMYLHLNYKHKRRNLWDKMKLVKNGSYDYVKAMKRHALDYGILNMMISYLEFITRYFLVPFAMVLCVTIFRKNLFSISLLILFVFFYLAKEKLQVLNIVFFPLACINMRKYYGQSYEITNEIYSDSFTR